MGYLVTHIAACLVFAQLLGLLLGWLLWGYMARQRAIEVRSLRERIADLQILGPRMAFAGDPAAFMPSPAQNQVTAASESHDPGVDDPSEDTTPDLILKSPVLPKAPLPFDTLEAEVKEARLGHLEQQVRELEGFRDRLPLVQADLTFSIAARRELETRLEQTRSQLEVRESSLLNQIRDFEHAAAEWDRTRSEFERAEIAREKELASVRALLRDIQNNQLPQKAEPLAPASVSAMEHTDLRERYQKALMERDAVAAQFEAFKQQGDHGQDSARVAELEAALRSKDASMEEQLQQTETLLWRVAELEPFAMAAPGIEENLRRQESEIAGHVAMHAESAEHIRTLLNRITELESDSTRVPELQERLNERDFEIEYHQVQAAEAAEQLSDVKMQLETLLDHHAQLINKRDADNAKSRELLVAAREEHAAEVRRLERRVQDLEPDIRHAAELDKMLAEREAEIKSLRALHTETESRLENAHDRLAELQSMHASKQQNVGQLAEQLETAQQRLHALESQLQLQEAECRGLVKQTVDQHHAEIIRLKTSAAQRMRRVRLSVRS